MTMEQGAREKLDRWRVIARIAGVPTNEIDRLISLVEQDIKAIERKAA